MGSLLRAALAGILPCLPSLYIYHALQTEATFQKRANVERYLPLPFWVALGYGGTLAFAVYAVYFLFRKSRQAAQRGLADTVVTYETASLDTSILLKDSAVTQ